MGFLKGVALAAFLTSAGAGVTQRRHDLQLLGPVTNCDLGPDIKCTENATHLLFSSQEGKQTLMVKGPDGSYTLDAYHGHPLGNQSSPPPPPGTQSPLEGTPFPNRLPVLGIIGGPGTKSPPEGTPFPIWLIPVLGIIACGAGAGASSIACGMVLPYLETRWPRQSTSGVPLTAIEIDLTPPAHPPYTGTRGVLVQSSSTPLSSNLDSRVLASEDPPGPPPSPCNAPISQTLNN